MILNQNNRNIERSGIKVEREATIVADAVAFKVLSDMLYPDKPLAIIRELLCNAMDSHVDAGKPTTPVQIHLPNALEPYLSIRDEGLGLSFRDTCVLLLTYFKSTKRGSNKVTGALGLGSKSPFSYVDSYTVTSRYNGRKFMFNAFINENGNPSMALLAKERTNEPNGLEITVPVRRSDFQTFHQRAASVIQWFKVKPIVTGVTNFTVNEVKYIAEGANWKIAEYNHYSHRAMAIQGNIAYPIDPNSMPDLPDGYANLFNMPIHFEFNIGDISFTAGRDAISYDKNTVSNLINALADFIKDAPQRFQSQFDTCTTLWEATCKYQELVNGQGSYSVISEMSRLKLLQFTWNKTKIDSGTLYFAMKDVPDTKVRAFYHNSRASMLTGQNVNHRLTVSGDKTYKFFVNDMAVGHVTRVRQYRKDNQGHSGIIVIETNDSAELKTILDALGNPPTTLTSTLPKVVRDKTNSVSKSSIRKLVNPGSRFGGFANMDEDLDLDDGGLYIPLLRDKAVTSDEHRNEITYFQNIIKSAYEMGLLAFDEVVYGASPKVLKQFTANEDWLNVLDVVKERFIAKVKSDNLADSLATMANYNSWNENSSGYQAIRSLSYRNNSFIASRLGTTHELAQFQKAIENMTDVSDVANTNNLMSRWLEVDIKQQAGTAKYDFVKMWTQLITKYPMIAAMHYPQNGDDAIMIQYIKHMDEFAELKAKI